MSTHDYGTGFEAPVTGGTLPPVGGSTSTSVTAGTAAGADDGSPSSGVTDTAKAKASEAGSAAADVASSAKDSAKDVAGTAVEQGKDVAREAVAQGRQLGQELKTQVSSQVSSQQDTLRQLLEDASSELRDMSAAGSNGVASTVARQAAERTEILASYLRDHEPSDVREELRSFARRRPGAFLLGAGLAGVVAGRFLRGVKAASDAESDTTTAPRSLQSGDAADRPAISYAALSDYPAQSSYPEAGSYPTAASSSPAYGRDPFAVSDPVDLPEDPVLVRGQRDV